MKKIIVHTKSKIILPPALHTIILYELHNQVLLYHITARKIIVRFSTQLYLPRSHRSNRLCTKVKNCYTMQSHKVHRFNFNISVEVYENNLAPLKPGQRKGTN